MFHFCFLFIPYYALLPFAAAAILFSHQDDLSFILFIFNCRKNQQANKSSRDGERKTGLKRKEGSKLKRGIDRNREKAESEGEIKSERECAVRERRGAERERRCDNEQRGYCTASVSDVPQDGLNALGLSAGNQWSD